MNLSRTRQNSRSSDTNASTKSGSKCLPDSWTIVERAGREDEMYELVINLGLIFRDCPEMLGKKTRVVTHPLQVGSGVRVAGLREFGENEDGDVASDQRQNALGGAELGHQFAPRH